MNAIYGCNWMHSNTTCGGLNKFIIFLVKYIFKLHKIQSEKDGEHTIYHLKYKENHIRFLSNNILVMLTELWKT